MVRKKLVIGNWKMNGGLDRNAVLLSSLAAKGGVTNVDVVICPPYTYLAQALVALAPAGIAVGAQNLSAYKEGAYTGEVSAAMLVDLGCGWVIVGHSERRNLFGETDDVVTEKVRVAIDAGLRPVLCVGESLLEREAGEAEIVVCRQLDHVVSAIGAEKFAEVVVAYEPVWAIGTGKTATPEVAQAMHKGIRLHLAVHGIENVRILYGGSVTAVNASQLFSEPDIDGALVGGASLVADSFLSICAAAAAH